MNADPETSAKPYEGLKNTTTVTVRWVPTVIVSRHGRDALAERETLEGMDLSFTKVYTDEMYRDAAINILPLIVEEMLIKTGHTMKNAYLASMAAGLAWKIDTLRRRWMTNHQEAEV